MLTLSRDALKTKRLVVGQVSMCRGCCCGNTERGKPEVPVEWLKAEWRRLGLLRNIQLTISGCLGPCDLSNVVTVLDSSGAVWLGNISRRDQYQALVDWAVKSKVAGTLLPLPEEFNEFQFDPFLAKASAC
jgi:cobaltochelatase CobN